MLTTCRVDSANNCSSTASSVGRPTHRSSVASATTVLPASASASSGGGSFRSLTADCASTLEVVARFLGLLELYREGVVSFEQVEALGDLHLRWTGETGQSAPDPQQEDA